MDDRKIINGISHFFRINIILLFILLFHSVNMLAPPPAMDLKDNDKRRDIKALYRLANTYFESRDYKKAEQYYDSLIGVNPTKYPLAYYRKGVVCMNLQKYGAAKESFTKFKKYYGKKDRFNYKKLAVTYTANSEWAKAGADTNGNIIITHQINGLNHSDIDFSPSPVDDNTIIYGAAFSDNNTQINSVRQIYKAEKNDGKWQSAGLLEGKINNPDFNTGNAVISDDGMSIYFTRSRKNWQNEYISEIFVSHFEGDQWQAPQKLPYPINREDFTATQPALGKNLRTGKDILYFVSDRPVGRGGMDIWYSQYDKKTDTYSNPVALSNKINSMGDECSPFYDISTQTLYFSSSGRKNGLGGYDIYKATGSAAKWTDAVPMPKPVNSSFDDYYFSIMKSNREGFFSSNRPGSLTLSNGTCCDDIYSFFINECVKIYSWGTVRNAVNYDFYDNLNEKYHLGLKYPESNSTIPDVPVELYLTDEKGNDEILIGRTTTNRNGNYSFGLETDKYYKVLVKNYGYMEKRVSIYTHNIFCSDTIDIGTTFIAYLPKITIQLNIYYDFDKYKLSDSARQVIDSMVLPLFDIFPNGIVEIGSHTDNKGTDEYNIVLSQKRSESVVNYLVSKGISPERLVAKGYGMRNPIAPNTNKDGSDNPEGRQLNRRTEFKIVGEVSKFYKDEY
jgi:outer membrane protein OmpA-like peptidoglycan-associated protein/tetratricopeptide (TPR) repeat protein